MGFLQNHDQIGNRALGERIAALAGPDAVRAATAVLLLSPALPLLFMGEEWAAPEPFLFFSDLGPDLGPAVSEGRRREFARFPEFADGRDAGAIPDPQARDHGERSVLDWTPRDPRAQGLVRIPPGAARDPGPRSRRCSRASRAARRWRPRGRDRARGRVDIPGPRGAAPRRQPGRGGGPSRGAGPEWGRPLYALGLPSEWSTLPRWSVGLYLSGARP